jgi:hypothetical protein
MLSTAWWTFSSAGESLASSIPAKIIFAKLSFLGVSLVLVCQSLYAPENLVKWAA